MTGDGELDEEELRQFLLSKKKEGRLRKDVDTKVGTIMEKYDMGNKGFLDLAGETRRGILQGVYELYTVSYGEEWQEDEPRVTELVFIGRDLDVDLLERGMQACAADV